MQNMNKNLISKPRPDPRYLATAVAANNKVTSSLVIKNASHLDSGSFTYVTVLLTLGIVLMKFHHSL